VYAIPERKCSGTDTQINACKNITLLELVKGNFYTVGKNEIAFVVWSGNPTNKLLYTTKKYTGNPQLSMLPSSVLLSRDRNYQETLEFISQENATYKFGNPGTGMSELKVGRINKQEIKKYKKEYPGSD
jgi:hypothetical protein